MNRNLIKKFNVQGPRYTSYPTVPYWNTDHFTPGEWKLSLMESLHSRRDKGISIYIHLPFCESLCTFCGCHKKITRNHGVEDEYIECLLKEWALYKSIMPARPLISEIHLGGGTPTFFSPDNLKKLINGITAGVSVADNYSFSIEGHPNNTTDAHLRVLSELGFSRISFGVQDYNSVVQKAINRIQPFKKVAEVHRLSKHYGFRSVNHDLVYGLPHQTMSSITDTIEKTCLLLPERIAFYSYAHVPWIKGNGQRGFRDEDLPDAAEKRALYECGKELLLDFGYKEIGMDHFALDSDELYIAQQNKRLHRNFMGYTSTGSNILIGLGMSAISDSWNAFAQNEKDLSLYKQRVQNGELPVFRGHILTEEDLALRGPILDLMCNFETAFEGPDNLWEQILEDLTEFISYGLISVNGRSIKVRETGVPFIRNICMAFDRRLQRSEPDTPLFSKTI